MEKPEIPPLSAEALQLIRDEAEKHRRIGSISGIGALAGSIAVSFISPPVGLAIGIIGAAVAAKALVDAEGKDREVEDILQNMKDDGSEDKQDI
jgi:uncharacterized membrane protein